MKRWAAIVFVVAALALLILEGWSAEKAEKREHERRQREAT